MFTFLNVWLRAKQLKKLVPFPCLWSSQAAPPPPPPPCRRLLFSLGEEGGGGETSVSPPLPPTRSNNDQPHADEGHERQTNFKQAAHRRPSHLSACGCSGGGVVGGATVCRLATTEMGDCLSCLASIASDRMTLVAAASRLLSLNASRRSSREPIRNCGGMAVSTVPLLFWARRQCSWTLPNEEDHIADVTSSRPTNARFHTHTHTSFWKR